MVKLRYFDRERSLKVISLTEIQNLSTVHIYSFIHSLSKPKDKTAK